MDHRVTGPAGLTEEELDRQLGALDDAPPEVRRLTDALSSLVDLPELTAVRHLGRLEFLPPAASGRARRRPGRVRARRLATGGATLVLAGTLFGGVGVAAAQTSRPGDLLYGLKTTHERLQVAAARPGDGRAGVHLRLAQARLDEASRLLRAGDGRRATETLRRADGSLAAARGDGSPRLDAAADGEMGRRVEVLRELLSGGLPETAADAARQALANAVGRVKAPAQPAGPPRPPAQRPPRPTPGGRVKGGKTPPPRPTPSKKPDKDKDKEPRDDRPAVPTPKPKQQGGPGAEGPRRPARG